MNKSPKWIDHKIKEEKSMTFIRGIFKKAGYEVMNYGIENHNQEIVKTISGNYKSKTNLRLMCMPDFVVVDPETKKSELVEIKYREFDFFNWDKSTQIFPYRSMKNYMEYWHDAILIIVMNVAPFALAILINDIDWNKHFVGKRIGNKGLKDDLWLFSDIQKQLPEFWSKVTHEIIEQTLELQPLEKPKTTCTD